MVYGNWQDKLNFGDMTLESIKDPYDYSLDLKYKGNTTTSNATVSSQTTDNSKPTPKAKADDNEWGKNEDTGKAIGGGINAATGIFSALKAYNQQKQNAAISIASAKKKHSLNTQKFGVSRQDSYISYLVTKGKMDQQKYNVEASFNNNNASIDTGLNKVRNQMTQSTQAVSQQLLHGYHRLSALDLSNIQGQLGQSQMQLENAQSQAKMEKEQNSFNKDMQSKQLENTTDMSRLSAKKDQLKINLQQSEETDAYNSQLAEIKRQMEAAKKARNSAIASGVGKIGGMIVGGVVGGPVGAQIGGSIGGGVGGAAAGW